jgi:colicin import membrane protein
MTEIVTVGPKQFGLEESKAADIAAQFKPMLDKMVELETEYNEVIAMPIETAAPAAKALRLKYVKVRTGTDKIHKEQKAFYLAAGRFVDGWKNAQLFAAQGIEAKLEEIENHAANLEKQRIAALQAERELALQPYEVENVQQLSLGSMATQVWENFLSGTVANYNARKEAERVAEEQRLAAIEAEKQRIEEQRIENERLKAEAEERERILAEERAAAEKQRIEAEEKLAAERAEAARLAKIEADKQAAKIAEIEAENKRVREKAAAELKAQQEAAAKLAAELQAKKDAEAKAEADRIAAEKKAAKAPVKEKLRVAVNALQLELPESELSADITAKFNGFKQWALTQIESL